MYILLVLFSLVILFFIWLRLFAYFAPVMGANITGKRLEKVQESSNFSNGIFYNPTPTSLKMPADSFVKIMWKWLMTGSDRIPKEPIPNLAIDFEKIGRGGNEKALLCWLGHSSLLMKFHGKIFLVDPVFSHRASMFSFFGPQPFEYKINYQPEDFLNVDAVIYTHDHYDHLDYPSVPFLKKITSKFIVPLGVGSHLEKWGIESESIKELDWGESLEFDSNITFTCEPTRHFAGRGFVKRFTSLWCSWVVEGDAQRIYLGSDSGYHDGFKKLGEKYDSFDLAVLECGGYSEYWSQVHMMPEETLQAHLDLNAEVLLPIHWAKYDLSVHHWKEPIERLSMNAISKGVNLITPRIGEVFIVNEDVPKEKWWEEVK